MKKKLTLMFVALIAVAAFATTQMLTSRRAATAITIGETELTAANNDVFQALKTAKDAVVEAGGEVGDITINLAAKGSYTLSGVLEAPANLTINGKGATIDASTEGADNIIGIKGVTAIAPKADGDPSTYAYVSAITIKDVTISGMKKALIRDYMENKTYLQTLTIDNCVIQASTAKVVVDFDGRGFVGNVVVKNSTIWAAAGTGKHFVKYGSRPNDFNNTLLQAFDVQNSTFVNIASNADFSGGANFNNFSQKGTANNSYTLKNNIFVNCGKNGQTVVGFNSGQTNATPAWDVDGNAFNWNGEDTSATEVSKAGKKNEVDIVQNSVVGVVVFEGAATGNFTLGTECAQYAAKIGDPRWIKYAVNIADGITNGKVEVDKTTATEGEEITITATPAEGYKLASVSVRGVTTDLAVTVTNNKFTMPADAVTVNATFAQPEDITINPASGDIIEALATATTGKIAKNITINLTENGAYTVSAPIEATANIAINGATGATIDASGLTTGAFINYASVIGEKVKKADGVTPSDYTQVGNVEVKNVKITGLAKSFINNSAGKVLFSKVTVDNVNVEVSGSNAIFALGNGYPADLKIMNSTLWAKGEGHKGFLFQAHGKAPDINADYKTSWSIDKSTLYQIGVGKKLNNTNTFKGKNYLVMSLTNSILVNTGTSTGSEVNGWLFGQNSTSPTITYANNTYWAAGAVVSGWTDATKAGSDQTNTSLTTDPTFVDAANGDFHVFAGSQQAKAETGDPRWLVAYDPTQALPVDITISPASGDINAALTTATTGVDKVGNITINLTENGAYTVSAPIEATANIAINGATGATIDASGLTTGAFINYASVIGEKVKKADGVTPSDYTQVGNVEVKNVKITGLAKSFINNSAGKVLFSKVTVDNVNVEVSGSNAIFALGNGYPADLKIMNSTLWAKGEGHKGFLFQAHGKAPDINADYKTSWSIDKSTLYQIGVGKKLNNTNTFKGKNYLVMSLTNSILVNTGTSTGSEVNGWLFGQNSTSPTITYANNTYWAAGAVVSGWTDATKAGSDQTNTSLTTDPKFKDAENGDFAIPTNSHQAKNGTGDPRWGTYDAGYLITVINVEGLTITPEVTYAAEGEKAYCTYVLAEDYKLERPDFVDDDNNPIEFVDGTTCGLEEVGGVEKMWIIMPAKNVTIKAKVTAMPKFYIIGDMNGWDRTAMTKMTYNEESGRYEYDYAPTTTVYFAFADYQQTAAEAEADATWETFNSTYRYSLGSGNVDATIGEIKSLTKGVDGTIVLQPGTYKISVEKDFNAVTITGEVAPPPAEDTYVVAGAPASLFGTEWSGNAEANKMTKNTETGLYELKFTGVAFTAATTIEYKIVKNSSIWIPDGVGNNQTVSIPAAGTYDITFTFNPEGSVITGVATVATGIGIINVDGVNDIFSDGKPVYNLSGQRVFKGYKGVVIKNGKKIVVK